MTIRRHLFLLITGVVLVIAIAQVALLFQFKNKVEDEVERRGKDFADKVLKYTVESIEQDDVTITDSISDDLSDEVEIHMLLPEARIPKMKKLRLHISKNDDPNYKFKLELPPHILDSEKSLLNALSQVPTVLKQDLVTILSQVKEQNLHFIELTQNGFNIKINTKNSNSNHYLKRHLKQQIERFKQESEQSIPIKMKTIIKSEPNKIWQTDGNRTRDPDRYVSKRKSQITQLFNYVTLVIVLTTLASIFVVFWLSNHFSKPLQELINGFKQLELGNFGIQVQPQGVAEVEQTIIRFNNMSKQLVKLADAETKLQQQKQLTEISDVSKGIAHALRNPMHTIGLAVEQLQNSTQSDTDKSKLFSRIQSKIRQLDKNINALLSITSDGLERNQNLALSVIIQDVILELKQTHDSNKCKLIVNTTLDDSIKLLGSESEFRSIVHTLIFNAYEASLLPNMGNTTQITINISTHKDIRQVVIKVVDFGSGINPEIKPQLFQPHCSSKSEGAGMGLYISKRLVELHYNGSLTVENTIDTNGVTAQCTLPNLVQ